MRRAVLAGDMTAPTRRAPRTHRACRVDVGGGLTVELRFIGAAPGYGVGTCKTKPSPVRRSDRAGSRAPSGWLTSAHSASSDRPRTSAIAAMVGKAGVATRPDSIF